MRYPTRLSIAIISLLFLHGCKGKCRSPKDEEYNISPDQLEKVPYNGLDTLVFLHNDRDTFELVGSGKKNYAVTIDGLSGSCPPDQLHLHDYQIVFTNSDHKIVFDHYLFENHKYSSNILISLDKKEFENTAVSTGAPYDLASYEVAGRTYQNITLFPQHPIDTLYYNSEFGIIKIAMPGEKWELLQKK